MQHTNRREKKNKLNIQGYSVFLVPSQQDSYFERAATSCLGCSGGDGDWLRVSSPHSATKSVCVKVQISAPNIFFLKDLSMCCPSHTSLLPSKWVLFKSWPAHRSSCKHKHTKWLIWNITHINTIVSMVTAHHWSIQVIKAKHNWLKNLMHLCMHCG